MEASTGNNIRKRAKKLKNDKLGQKSKEVQRAKQLVTISDSRTATGKRH